MKPIESPEVAAVFDNYPPKIRRKLLALRELILKTAASTEGVGAIEETLKWGEPAYVTSETRSGSTIRISWKKAAPREYSLCFHCQTTLVASFRRQFPHEFTFDGNRRIVFRESDRVPRDSLSRCIAAALNYHRDKKARRNRSRGGSELTRADPPGTGAGMRKRTELRIRKSVRLSCRPEDVFAALTSSEEIVRYFPLDRVTSSWKVGSELRMEGTTGGRKFTDYGTIQILDHPHRFQYAYWSDNHGTENLPDRQVTIRYQLSEVDEGTLLEVTQSNLPTEDFRIAMTCVWDTLLDSLKRYLESRAQHGET